MQPSVLHKSDTDLHAALDLMRRMLQMGATDALLGHAFRDLVARASPSEVASTRSVDVPASPPPPPTSTPASWAAQGQRRAPSPPDEAAAPRREIINVRLPDGRRTSVCIPQEQWGPLLATKGGDAEALRAHIQQLAPQAPEGANRSRWTIEAAFGKGQHASG